ncbi:unnamed protein product, partial [Meganyctiphanes norvegica]
DTGDDINTNVDHILLYRGSLEGHYDVSGYAYNSINATEFETKVHVVPIIRTEDWTVKVMAAAYAVPPGEVTFEWACSSLDIAPWNVNFSMTNEDGSMTIPHI